MRRRLRSRLAALGVGTLLALVAAPARAHPLAPSLLDLREADGGQVAVVWKTPLAGPVGVRLEPELPAACRPLSAPTSEVAGSGLVTRFRLDCGPEGLAGRRVGVHGLAASGTNALVRFEGRDGAVVQVLLEAREPSLLVPAATSRGRVLRDFLALGIEHLARGIDHLLFVLGLLLLVRGARSLLLTLTSFTLGHSATLGLATLGLVRVPGALVEVAIALSIVLMAAEIPGRSDAGRSLFGVRPWRAAAAFGLLHGLGFAGALAEAGLPRAEIPAALFGFNLGIELAQVALVALAWCAWRGVLALRLALPDRGLRLAAAYGIGALAGYWLIERGATALSALVGG